MDKNLRLLGTGCGDKKRYYEVMDLDTGFICTSRSIGPQEARHYSHGQ